MSVTDPKHNPVKDKMQIEDEAKHNTPRLHVYM